MSSSSNNNTIDALAKYFFGLVASAFVLAHNGQTNASTPSTTPSEPFASFSFPPSESCKGNCSYIHDPSIVKRKDGTFFRFSTNGNIAIASAPEMQGPWEYLGAMLPQGSMIDVTEDQEIWCPDVFELEDGLWSAFYAVSTIGSQNSRIGRATSQTLEAGSWEDQGEVIIEVDDRWNLIDPNIFREGDDSDTTIVWGSAWDGIFQGKFQLGANGAGTVSGDVNVASNTSAIVEGGFQFWWPLSDGTKWYYLFFSSGACCEEPPDLSNPGDEYKIMVCRAKSPTGPFEDKNGKDCANRGGGSLVLGSHGDVYAPGGQGVIFDDDTMKSPVVYYHYVNPNVGYRYEDFLMGWNYLDFESGWPEVVKG